MAERYPEFPEILIGQIAQNTCIDVIVGKALRILGHAKGCQPVLDSQHDGLPYGLGADSSRTATSAHLALELQLEGRLHDGAPTQKRSEPGRARGILSKPLT